VSLGVNDCATNTYYHTREEMVLFDGQKACIRGVNVAHRLHEGQIGGERRRNREFGPHRKDRSTKKIRVFTTSEASVDETTVNGGPEVAHNIIGGLKMRVRWTLIELGKDGEGRGNIETTNLQSENQHINQSPVLETMFRGDSCDSSGVQRARSRTHSFEYQWCEWHQQSGIHGGGFPTEFRKARSNVRVGIHMHVLRTLSDISGVEQLHRGLGPNERDIGYNTVHNSVAIRFISRDP
jgi:hypothetical protein